MAGLVRNHLLPGAAARRQAEQYEAQRVRDALAAARLNRRIQEQVAAEFDAERNGTQKYRPRRNVVRIVRAALFRGRAPLRPVYAIIALYVVGWAFWWKQPNPVTAVIIFAVAACLWWRFHLRRHLTRRSERLYALACLIGAWLWLCSCLAWNPADRAWQLLYPWIVAALLWWGPGRHWPADWQPEPEIIFPDPHLYATRWEAKLAAQGRKFYGSHIRSTDRDENGNDVLIIQVEPGQQDYEMVAQNASAVASGLQVASSRIIVEVASGYDNPEGDPTRVQVKVLPKRQGKQIDWFLEPRYSEGKILLGKYLDGIGEGYWRIYDRGRMWGGSLWAGTGYGKTRLLELIAVTIRSAAFQAAYPTTIIYFDGQNGTSSNLLWDNSTMHAGVEDGDELLDELIREGEWRQKWNRGYGLTAFYPGKSPKGRPDVEGLPGILIIVDEQHGIINKNNVKRWERIAREFGKLGMAVIGADQITDLSPYGESDVLRSSMLAGNGGAMHIASRTAGNLVPGLPVDPYKLPKIPGYLVKIAGEGSGERTAPLQVRYMPDEQAKERGTPIPDNVVLAEEWFTRGAEAPLVGKGLAVAPIYLDRHRREKRLREELTAAIEGRTIESADTDTPTAAPSRTAVVEAVAKVLPFTAKTHTPDETYALGLQALGLAPDHQATRYDDLVRQIATEPQDAQDSRSTRDVVRDYLREEGRARRADIFAHVREVLGTSDSATKQVLKSMKDKGEVAAEGGVYELLEQAA